jgi:SAM-dependent methyltransferase
MSRPSSVSHFNGSSLITHCESDKSLDLNREVESIRARIRQEPGLSPEALEEKLSLLDQLTQFEFGKFLLLHKGINGRWIQYVVLYPENGRNTGLSTDGNPLRDLEKWILGQAPVVLATQERFRHFRKVLQGLIKEGCRMASVPCGLMADLLTLRYDHVNQFELWGIDLDEESLQAASQDAKHFGLEKKVHFKKRDAWKMDFKNEFDVLTSNGLNIYEPSEERLLELYTQFWNALKPGGTLVTSFVTPPLHLDSHSPWNLAQLPPNDLRLQKIIFGDLVQGKWQSFRSPEFTRRQLELAGFMNIEIIFDERGMFPTVVAKKSSRY